MGHTFNLKLTDEASEIEKKLSGEIIEDDWQVLLKFADYFEDLLETKFIKDGMKSSCVINFGESTTLEDDSNLPDDDTIAAFLHKIRPLVLQNEPTYFHNVCNIINKTIADAHFRAFIQKARDLYTGRDMQRQVKIDIDGIILNSEQSLNKWLNAFEYHRNEVKRAEFEAFGELMPLKTIKALFISLMTDQAQGVHIIYHIIRKMQKKDGRALTLKYDKSAVRN